MLPPPTHLDRCISYNTYGKSKSRRTKCSQAGGSLHFSIAYSPGVLGQDRWGRQGLHEATHYQKADDGSDRGVVVRYSPCILLDSADDPPPMSLRELVLRQTQQILSEHDL